MDTAQATAQLGSWTRLGVFSDLDKHLALTLAELDPESDGHVMLATALTSRAVRLGHVCLRLSDVAGSPPHDAAGNAVEGPALPELSQWRRALGSSRLVGDGQHATPLVLSDDDKLYLYRYYDLEVRLAATLTGRIQELSIDEAPLAQGLQRWFPQAADSQELDTKQPDHQALAAIATVSHRLALISGGPGTGKTTTVAKILALLAEQELAEQEPNAATASPERLLDVLLLGPTGKATQRLATALSAGLSRLDLPARLEHAISYEAKTIHRALGYRPRTPTRFRRNANNPLLANVVVIDEASMVDLALMTRLLEAIRSDARVILLGDHEQLTSVEAGSIFGDICASAWDAPHSPAYAQRVERLTGQAPPPTSNEPAPGAPTPPQARLLRTQLLRDSVEHLTHNYRYGADSEIARLAQLTNRGSADELLAFLASDLRDISFHAIADQPTRDATGLLEPLLDASIRRLYGPLLESTEPASQLVLLDRFRILTAHREGAFGVGALNTLTEHVLRPLGLEANQALYENRPIMISENDYRLGFFNGDVGIIKTDLQNGKRAWFQTTDQLVSISPSSLPAHETVFAMTVHKSQGSEFDEVALVLPPSTSPLLSRELLYTAVTRAKQRVVLVGSPESLRVALGRHVRRASGLRERLWAIQEP